MKTLMPHLQSYCTSDTIPQHSDLVPKAPLKYWEVADFFKCPIAGLCLTPIEQKQLLKKAGHPVRKMSPFDMHEILVASAQSENKLSRRMDSLLMRKFGKKANAFLRLSSEEIKSRFKAAFEAGDCIDVVFAVAVHPNIPEILKEEIFGDIHMAMHWSCGQSLKLKRQITRKQKESDDLRNDVQEAIQYRRSLQKENKCLKAECDALKKSLAKTEREKAELEKKFQSHNDPAGLTTKGQENRLLKKKLSAARIETKQRQRQLIATQKKYSNLVSEFSLQKESFDRYIEDSRKIIADVVALNRCDLSCPSYDLCKKRILMVGGMTRMASLYRELVETGGGIFEYHDGYVKRGTRQLEERLKRADLVVCPVNCNSHAACSVVKNLGKKHNKTVHILENSSLNAVSQAIWGGANGETIN